jgi:hypothetical protein
MHNEMSQDAVSRNIFFMQQKLNNTGCEPVTTIVDAVGKAAAQDNGLSE